MSQNIIKEVSEIKIIETLNQEKRKQRKSGQGFAVNNAIKIKDSAEAKESEPVALTEAINLPEEKPSETTVTLETVKSLITSQLSLAHEELAKEQQAKAEIKLAYEMLKSEKELLEKNNTELKHELETAKKHEQVLQDIGKLSGKPEATLNALNFNKLTSPKSDSPQGSVKEFLEIQEAAHKIVKISPSGKQYVSHDNRDLNKFVKANKFALIQDLEAWAKNNGFLKGASIPSKDAATVRSDIASAGFLDVLSSIMRTNNRQGFIFWQFPTTVIDFGKGNGDTIKIPRAAYLPAPVNPDDRLLSSASTYTRIDSGNQSLSTGVVSAELREWGLGRNSQYPPVTLVSFVTAYSMIELISILNRNLMRDYNMWEDMKIRSLWTPTTRVVYNAGNKVVTTVSAANAIPSGSGTLTRKFLAALYGYMKEQQIPPYANNSYGLVLNSTALTQLKQEYDRLWHASTPQDLQSLTEFLNPSVVYPGETDKISGYVGRFENFEVFETNAYGVGEATSPGVQSETVNGSGRVTHTSFAFGSDTIGRGIGTEMEIRFDDDTDFGRASRAIWRSEESFVQLDVDPVASDTQTVKQQTRVLQVRTLLDAI